MNGAVKKAAVFAMPFFRAEGLQKNLAIGLIRSPH